jgi:acetyl esterase/lipase
MDFYRRAFLGQFAAVAWAGMSRTRAADAKPATQTFTYKTAAKCAIRADVYRDSGEQIRPVAVWIHGGALIMGSRAGMDIALRNQLLMAGYAVVSIDYRLAPETKLPGIVEDVQDAFRWLRDQGPKLFHIDPKRVAVLGGSAGGYLTLLAGYRVTPRPQCLVSYWGYGDIVGAWYSKPDPFYRTKPLVSKEDAYAAVGGPAVSEGGGKDRSRFYLYCRQQGLWPNEVMGRDPEKEPKVFDPFCPMRNVTAEYPPTLLIHGTKDTDVPYERSAEMAKELARHKVVHELITVPGAGHGLGGVAAEEITKIRNRAVAFVKQHTGG